MRRHLTGALTALALSIPSLGLVGTAAADQPTTTLDVYVYDSQTYQDLAATTVELYDTANGDKVGESHTTDADGDYTFTDVTAGSYTVKATKTGYYAEYTQLLRLQEGYESSTSIYLDRTAAVEGKVSGTATYNGAVYGDFSVRAYVGRPTESAVASWDAEFYYLRTDASGHWGGKIPVGDYTIRIEDDTNGTVTWVGATPAGSTTVANASLVSVSANGVTSVPAVAFSDEQRTPSRMSGRVTSSTGAGLNGVTVYLSNSAASYQGHSMAYTTTDKDGTFQFTGRYNQYNPDTNQWGYYPLLPGDYRIRVADESVGEYSDGFLTTTSELAPITNYYGAFPANLATFTVPATGALAVPAIVLTKPQAEIAPSVGGRLTDRTGAPVQGSVYLTNEQTKASTHPRVGRDGTWQVFSTQLAPGTYTAYFRGDDFLEQIGTVTVPVTGTTDAGTVVLGKYATISGTVALTGHDDLTLSRIGVELLDVNGDRVTSNNDVMSLGYDGGYTESGNGAFSISGIAPGDYLLRFWGQRQSVYDDELDYIASYYGGSTVDDATVVTVKADDTLTLTSTLTRVLSTTAAPSITGTAKAGNILTAKAGTWTKRGGTTYTYAWKIGSQTVSTAATYKVGAGLAGKRLTLTVTAANPDWETGTASATVTVAKTAALIAAEAKVKAVQAKVTAAATTLTSAKNALTKATKIANKKKRTTAINKAQKNITTLTRQLTGLKAELTKAQNQLKNTP